MDTTDLMVEVIEREYGRKFGQKDVRDGVSWNPDYENWTKTRQIWYEYSRQHMIEKMMKENVTAETIV